MVSRAWLLGVIFAVPLIGFAVAQGIQVHFNSELRSVLRQQFPDADAASTSVMTIDRICENPDAELRDLCGTNRNLNLMSTAALGAGAAGAVLLLLIRLAGTATRGSRNLLLYVFKPGLYLTALTLIGLASISTRDPVGRCSRGALGDAAPFALPASRSVNGIRF